MKLKLIKDDAYICSNREAIKWLSIYVNTYPCTKRYRIECEIAGIGVEIKVYKLED